MTTRRGFLAWCAGALAALVWPAKAVPSQSPSFWGRVIARGHEPGLYILEELTLEGDKLIPAAKLALLAFEANGRPDVMIDTVVLAQPRDNGFSYFQGEFFVAPLRVDWTDRNDPNYGRRGQVIDLDTGESVGPCQWADEATGEYRVLLQDERGLFYTVPDRNGWLEVAHAIRRGRIKIVFEA